MINNYEIKTIDGKETLYLYFDFNYEFSKEDIKNIKTKIEENIQEFIKKNKISFKGTTILLISGGILFGSINLNTPTYTSISMENPIKVQEILKEEKIEETKETITEEPIIEKIKEEKPEYPKEEIIEQKQEVIEQKEEVKTEEKKQTDKIEKQEQQTSKIEKQENKETPKQQEEQKKDIEEVIDNNIYINIKRNGEIKKIELEEYVIGVVGAEMPASFNIEALKAQAVIARTYALKANLNGKTLTDNESTQSYKSTDELKNIWGSSYTTYYNKIKEAVISTKGMYLTYNGNYIDAVYHSTSNGKTESSTNVWGNYYPYLVSVESPYDSTNPSYIKTINISYEEISKKLGIEINENTEFTIIERTIGDRIGKINIENKTYTGVELRNILGLRSADFDIEKTNTGVNITTRGYGHGVGLSQYGANGFAKNGYTYKEILKHYYKGASIGNL